MKSNINDCVILPLNKIHNRAGNLTIAEGNVNIPFPVKRIYYIYDIPGGEARGGHAHKQLNQFVVSASGSFNVLLDDGQNKKIVTLNRPDYGLLILPGIWRELVEFSSGAICLVLASHKYDETDYIKTYRTYKIFRNLSNKNEIEFEDYSIEYLKMSGIWLRDPLIKELTLTPTFTDEDQKKWFESLHTLKDYYIRGIRINGLHAGAYGLKHITKETAEYWGYIGEKQFWGQGFGKLILLEAIKQAKAMKLKSIYLKVLDSNVRALNLYITHGFKFTDKTENIHNMTLDL